MPKFKDIMLPGPKLIDLVTLVPKWPKKSKLKKIDICLLSKIFQHKYFCLKIILAMLKMNRIVDISHNWVAYVLNKLSFKIVFLRNYDFYCQFRWNNYGFLCDLYFSWNRHFQGPKYAGLGCAHYIIGSVQFHKLSNIVGLL